MEDIDEDDEDGNSDCEDEVDLEDPFDGPEIVEQSALEHFSAVLQEAQQIAIE